MGDFTTWFRPAEVAGEHGQRRLPAGRLTQELGPTPWRVAKGDGATPEPDAGNAVLGDEAAMGRMPHADAAFQTVLQLRLAARAVVRRFIAGAIGCPTARGTGVLRLGPAGAMTRADQQPERRGGNKQHRADPGLAGNCAAIRQEIST